VIDHLLSCFELLLAQSKAIAKRLRDLGAPPSKVRVCGNLKFAATPLTCDLGELKQLQTILKGRSVWVAASTHLDEETLVADVHQMVKKTLPKLLTVIIPRHPRRGLEIAQGLRAKGLQVARRSNQERIKPSTDIYLVDTIGELGLFYRLSDIAFLGGTFVPIGGHNPIEAVLLDCALIWGPHTHKQTEICDVLRPAACSVATKEELAITLEKLHLNPHLRAEMIARAHKLLEVQAHILDHVMNALRDSLPKAA
jgi:3-deoxy-D-manno-octulosonic-acid transferase